MGSAENPHPPTPRLDAARLRDYVSSFLDRGDSFRRLVESEGSPLYVFDKAALVSRAREFMTTFRSYLPAVQPFYAVKSNHSPLIARTLVEEGYGLDVSSGDELTMALAQGADKILFSGPGKMEAELDLAVEHADAVTVLIDSFGELERLEQAAARRDRVIRAGVRLTTSESGFWRKFGLPLERLEQFIAAADKCEHVKWCGLQFHISWNMNPDNQVIFLNKVSETLGRLPAEQRRRFEFIDVGGGFWPPHGEWLQPSATPESQLHTARGESFGGPLDHFCFPAAPLGVFAERISSAVTSRMPSDLEFVLYCEPGRWLCHEAMHILVTVVDRKADDLVITDAGTNMVGWERFENDFFPVINLTRPALTERECLVAGSLCTPHDIWGYSYFGDDIQAGDLLLVPHQGAYTYSLRQHFIKPLPKVATLPDHAARSHSGGTTERAV